MKGTQPLPFTEKKHKSILRRVLGHTDPVLQENKIVNLKIALREVDGIVIHPGEIFSFWKLIQFHLEVWRQVVNKLDDSIIDEELVNVNHAEVKYMKSNGTQENE